MSNLILKDTHDYIKKENLTQHRLVPDKKLLKIIQQWYRNRNHLFAVIHKHLHYKTKTTQLYFSCYPFIFCMTRTFVLVRVLIEFPSTVYSYQSTISGSPGSIGAVGPQGPPGFKGDRGDRGPQGPMGMSGQIICSFTIRFFYEPYISIF